MKQLANFVSFGYAAQGFLANPNGASEAPAPKVYGRVVGGHVNADGGKVATPAEAAGIWDITPMNEMFLGNELSIFINTDHDGFVLAMHFSNQGVSATAVESMTPEQRAQHVWNTLSRSEAGRAIQTDLAQASYLRLLDFGRGGPESEGRTAEL